MLPQPKSLTNPLLKVASLQPKDLAGLLTGLKKAVLPQRSSIMRIEDFTLSFSDKTKLLYQVNTTTSNLQLCILLVVALDIPQITYKKGYPGSSHCYQIVTRFCYIRDLTKLMKKSI